ncbi:MAG: cytochrome c oxidase subunit II [Micromonosporaceae bacterium]|nr:cytochrome c oxidase subunit II [Micromonosporaceae bacterium]
MVAQGRDVRSHRVRRWVGFSVIVPTAAVLLSGCSADDVFGFGWPKGITDQSRRMYDLWIGSVVAALVVGVLVWGLIFWCVVRYRKRGDELPPQTRYNMPIELLYTVMPFLVVAVLFYYTAVVQTDVDKVQPNPDVTVNVVAFKWNWQFVYPEVKTGGGQPIATQGGPNYIPVLVLPTHKRVRFVEHSEDVIHSFWVPELLFKRDVFPGNVTNTFEVTIEKEGAYVGRCAELCGTYHSMMNFELRAVSDAEYQRFVAAKQQGMTTPDALRAAGDDQPLATTTTPFNTERNTGTAS